ncbi:hypothetical protein MRX96_033697 [Rhipicephalus microplus]
MKPMMSTEVERPHGTDADSDIGRAPLSTGSADGHLPSSEMPRPASAALETLHAPFGRALLDKLLSGAALSFITSKSWLRRSSAVPTTKAMAGREGSGHDPS